MTKTNYRKRKVYGKKRMYRKYRAPKKYQTKYKKYKKEFYNYRWVCTDNDITIPGSTVAISSYSNFFKKL